MDDATDDQGEVPVDDTSDDWGEVPVDDAADDQGSTPVDDAADDQGDAPVDDVADDQGDAPMDDTADAQSDPSEQNRADTQEDAFSRLSDYMNDHNYGKEDFAEYSQDPEWQKLHAEAFPDYKMPEQDTDNTQAAAFNKLSDYMNEHNYGKDDFPEYSQDPEWQKLHAEAFPDYKIPEQVDADTVNYQKDTRPLSDTEAAEWSQLDANAAETPLENSNSDRFSEETGRWTEDDQQLYDNDFGAVNEDVMDYNDPEYLESGKLKPNWGADAVEAPDQTILPEGTRIVQYAHPGQSGSYFAPEGTKYDDLQLPDSADKRVMNVYEVQEGALPVDQSEVAIQPWNETADGSSGTGAQQYRSADIADSLVEQGKLKPVEPSESAALDDGIDWERMANTPEEELILRDMAEKGEIDIPEVDPSLQEPVHSDVHLPTEKTGKFIGEAGNSEFIPNSTDALDKMAEYGRSSVDYKDNYPDFSPFTRHESPWGPIDSQVEIPHMTADRENPSWEMGKRPSGTSHDPNYDLGNFSQADNELLAALQRQYPDQNINVDDVVNFRKQNKLTWHECPDGKTMQLVPREIHDACRHSGGVSEMKYRMAYGNVSLPDGD